MATFPHHENLRLVNFTAFADASFEWSSSINAIIGANGTGKTHLLKVLYAVQHAARRRYQDAGDNPILSTMKEVFQVKDVAELIRNTNAFRANASGRWADDAWEVLLRSKQDSGGGMSTADTSVWKASSATFIPASDMIGHTKRFLSTYDKYEIDFDQTRRDIVAALLSRPLREQLEVADALKPLAEILGGEVEEEGERFYLRTAHGRQPMPLVAEGLRKIATLYTLLKNGYLRPGDTLFWDEPETNLNPTLMDEVVAALFGLARSGVQIFLTTHSYFVLQELDLQAKPTDRVRYFNLRPTPNGTQVDAADDFVELEDVAIMNQADYVFDRMVTRATGRKRKK